MLRKIAQQLLTLPTLRRCEDHHGVTTARYPGSRGFPVASHSTQAAQVITKEDKGPSRQPADSLDMQRVARLR